MAAQLEACCVGLQSSKITERKKCADLLMELLDNKTVIKCLSNNLRITWDSLLKSVHIYLQKEAEKFQEDESKNKTISGIKRCCGDLLVNVFNKANSRNAKLDISQLILYFLEYFNSNMLKRYFESTYLHVLKAFLSTQNNYGSISSEELLELSRNLKIRYSYLSNSDKIKPLQCLEFLFKWGPLHSLPSTQLRQEFAFITSLANEINASSLRSTQELILRLVLTFCQQVAEDNRVACCKLGEEVFINFISIYQSQVDDIKILILKFFLLQVRIHHPNGSIEGSVSAYACSWTEWRKFLRSMYSVLCSDLNNQKIIKTQMCLGGNTNVILLPSEFLELVVEIFRQVYNNNYSSTMLEVTQISDMSQQASKKRRVEVGIPSIIEIIQEKKDWLWISAMSELLRKYPNLLSPQNFVNLLRVLSTLQAECKFANTRYHLYECLATLIDVQASINVSDDEAGVRSLWTLVSDSTLRAIGLNENEKKTHKLLQKLISSKKPINATQLFKPYLSQIVNVCKFSLDGLNEACLNFDLSISKNENVDVHKKTLIKWILNVENRRCDSNVFLEEITARVLLSLTFKQWPRTNNYEKNEINESVQTIECLYLITSFDSELVLSQNDRFKRESTDDNNVTYLTQSAILSYLIEELYNFALTFTQAESTNFATLKDMVNVSCLLANVLSFMLKYNILENQYLEQHKLCNILKILFEKWSHLLSSLMTNIKSKNKHLMVKILKQIQKLLSLPLHNLIYLLVRQNISTEVIKALFQLLNQEDENDDILQDVQLDTQQLDELSLAGLHVLCTFCCVPNVDCVFDTQLQALQELAKPEFEADIPYDYEIAMTFLFSLNKYKPGTLSDEILSMVLKNVQNICQTRYTNYNTALNVLKILRDLYPHIAKSNNNLLEENSVTLLYPFYHKCENYGPEVSVEFLNCIGKLAEVDTHMRWAKWKGEDIPSKIPEFLSSDFQIVRITAIKMLHEIFSTTCQTEQQIERQKMMFESVCVKSVEVFNVIGELSEERRVDETVTRTASALHTFATLMATSAIFRLKSLVAFLKLMQNKKLDIEISRSVLETVSKHLNIKNSLTFVETNLKYLITEWHDSLSDFPYTLLNCSSEIEFYTKYTEVVFPILFTTNQTLLNEVCQHLNTPIQEVVLSCYPNVISRCLLTLACEIYDAKSLNEQEVKFKNNCIANLTKILSEEECEKLIVTKLDEVICSVLGYCFDPNSINEKFEVFCIFPEAQSTSFSTTIVKNTLNYVEEKYLNSLSLISYCAQNCRQMLQKILLNSFENVHNATSTEEKIIAFYRCTIFVDLIASFLNETTDYNVYFVRTTSYNLIHLISDTYKTSTLLNVICCKYFYEFITKILPNNASILQTFLVTFVSSLIPIAKCDNELGSHCIKLLNLLIVDHSNELLEGITLLDPFPQEEKFEKMQLVYKRVRYSDTVCLLDDEIGRFLKTNDLMGTTGNRIEGLRHLKSELSIKKVEVKQLYEDLKNSRGFSEDCEKSIIHQLICVLVKLSLSSDYNESIEATRCLGELGFADLSTTILQAEHTYGEEINKPFELVTGCITGLLSKYIVNFDTKLVRVASKALYHVLDSKEGKAILTSETDYGHGIIQKSHIMPFTSTRTIRSETNYNLIKEFENKINRDSLWCPESRTSHADWITKLVCTILETFNESCYLTLLIPVCKAKVEFAESLLPLVIFLILTSKNSKIISVQIQKFFMLHWKLSTQNCIQDENICTNKLSIQCMLNVVHFVRLRKNCQSNKRVEELSLNYLHVAQAAQFCTAHFTALLYVDLYSQTRILELNSRSDVPFYKSGVTPLDYILQHEPADVQQALRNILKESYKKVGELDALNACQTIDLLSTNLRIERYEHLQQWDQVALHYDIQVSQGDSSKTPNMLNALKKCSLFQLPLKYKLDVDVEPQYECAWRLSQWNFNKSDLKETDNFEAYKYFALKSIHDNDTINFNSAIKDARNSVVNSLKHASLESSKNLYEPLSYLQSISELEDFFDAKKDSNFNLILEKWKIQDQMNTNEFFYLESIRAQRIVLLNDLVSSGNETLKDALIEMHLNLAKLARIEDKHSMANRALATLINLRDLSPEVKNQIMMEQAQLYWLNDKTTARRILRHLLNNSPSPRLEAAALKLLGMWMVETSSENPHTIIKDYFSKSIIILNGLEKTKDNVNNLSDAFDVLARFADKEYQQVVNYIKSSIFERKVRNMERSKETASNLKKQGLKQGSDESRAVIIHERQCKIDENEIKNTYEEKRTYLILAMKYYISNLEYSDHNDVRMFRILSLWLENRLNTDLSALLNEKSKTIPSYKFVPILPQLVPHVTNNDEDSFGQQINFIIERCGKDHPHHTLPIILALYNSNKDREYCKTTTNTISNEIRVGGAEKVIERLKEQPSHEKLIYNLNKVSEALMQLAYVVRDSCKNAGKKNYLIPSTCLINKIKNLSDVLLPTCTLPIKKNCDYTNIIGISHFNKVFENVGGLNAPKRISCVGTDGILRNQLVKGQDDLRQDAVMQQVFNIMNGFLKANKKTSHLLIRTYKVVPLSQRSGVLEWVDNSVKFGEYLIGDGERKSGAHQMYNPKDYSPATCVVEYMKIEKLPKEEKLKQFKKICKNFQPVFHKFFEESFVQPAVWYERRRAYIYSVATSSMCGYILGLGDRHVQNLLIDKSTGELIHIDFGIAFEQGRVLPTPETVPFRLTRDIEAGMGILGVEGVFRKSCEKTLEVLRRNAETIITIVEVLLYDPLYAWTITPAQAYSRQLDDHSVSPLVFSDQENGSANFSAERALLRLRQKLEGTAEGAATSIEGQVEKLIQQARDPSNLCRLFKGWQSYL